MIKKNLIQKHSRKTNKFIFLPKNKYLTRGEMQIT